VPGCYPQSNERDVLATAAVRYPGRSWPPAISQAGSLFDDCIILFNLPGCKVSIDSSWITEQNVFD